MSNGDSLDGFVFPPFIPPAAARPSQPPAPAPQPIADEPAPTPEASASGRMTMPWDTETPIVREPAADVTAPADLAASEPATDEAEDEDLPWLERPAPREPAAPAAAAPVADAAAGPDDAFPDWLAWDDRATDEARSDAQAVAPVEGLQDFAPVDDLGGFVAPEPAVEWAEAAPPPAPAPAEAEATDWSLDAPEAAEPPVVAEAAPEVTFDTQDAAGGAEPAFEVTVEDGALTFAAADAEPADEPVAVPAESHPFVADTEAVLSAEPDPFTAACVSEAEDVAPAPSDAPSPAAAPATNGAFVEVAARLEDIARTLRERPDDLLSGAATDPLALLVAGYVMGYNARR